MRPDVLAEAVARAMRAALAPLGLRVAAADEARLRLEATAAELAGTLAMVRERVAVLETRAPVPGPSGPPGVDGLGVKEFDVAYDGERTFTLRWASAERLEERSFRLPVVLYRGTYTEGRTYDAGDVVTHQRSAWCCLTTTGTRPGEAAAAWQLMVMRGRDGRDGKDPK
jgi:hypothetical protein